MAYYGSVAGDAEGIRVSPSDGIDIASVNNSQGASTVTTGIVTGYIGGQTLKTVRHGLSAAAKTTRHLSNNATTKALGAQDVQKTQITTEAATEAAAQQQP